MKHIQSPNSRSTLTNVEQKDIQPNAVDLRIGKLFEVDGHSEFVISEDSKQHRKTYEIQPDADGWFTLARYLLRAVPKTSWANVRTY